MVVVPLEEPNSDGVLQFMWLFIISTVPLPAFLFVGHKGGAMAVPCVTHSRGLVDAVLITRIPSQHTL